MLAASLLKFGGDRREMPIEFRLRHSGHVNRKFRETLVYICEIFAADSLYIANAIRI